MRHLRQGKLIDGCSGLHDFISDLNKLRREASCCEVGSEYSGEDLPLGLFVKLC